MDWLKKIHKWASLIVGLQFLIWLSSGIFFNLMDHHKAGGHQYRAHVHHPDNIDRSRLIEPGVILAKADAATSLRLSNLLGDHYYLVNHEKGLYANFKNRYSLYDAYSGEPVIVDETLASAIAMESYNGPGEITSVRYLAEKLEDFPKQKNPSWQVNFNDDVNTSVYVEAGSGRIVGHSDDDKRFADIFFMLHFMDYGNEGSFNNMQIIVFAFFTFWLAATGVIWTVDLALKGQYKFQWFATERKVKLFDKHQQSIGEVTLSNHRNLLHELEQQNIILPSSCGGGGTCGKCRVLISPNAKITSADEQQFDVEELDEGYRLACQHFADDAEHMTLMDVTECKKVTLQLLDNKFLSPDIKELKFKAQDGCVDYKAGAFMRFLIPAGRGNYLANNIPDQYQQFWQDVEKLDYQHPACSRSYSIANAHGNNGELTFTVKMQRASHSEHLPGIGSNFIGNMLPGQTIEALGPFEDFFVRPESGQTLVLVGAGSGMAPLKAIIDEQLATQPEKNIVFIYGARSEDDLIYQQEFYQLAKTNKAFTYLPTLSRPGTDWLGAQGYAQDVLEMNFSTLGELSNLDFYLCGPQGMMEATIDLLKRRGVTEKRISFDDFS
ncbi:2Fe-2S iron-sulfur cluster-binding protein [Thalassotalea mangrovi]|uniref:2Fe-2S iron-sulfur cluster binding domain-containing protein n=1 Tax=Thalassotalea mangrovi TaxID=2572245 RepID=A0A4U1B9V2_9GAMM|nr:2Fe-2S iron-sulfur cluster-binding protein [Thalassotalea mangrovi]TKB47434.1 2Fe-2S iron-sulfur cluster binding domain-containing protein [Thalassotalea mangrovi]